ncbi:hypothetical protein [Isoptericola croceus]|uniref:hypothetical protein n=1 Tax=Isoptericola croceus TaxID=3031406 RepID=UPI0023F70517|nr:hypothetical protein [Isoptericola croceus]
MSTFTESAHPRGGDGKFATKAVSEAPGGTEALTGLAATPPGYVPSSLRGRDPLTRRQFGEPRTGVYGDTEWIHGGEAHRTNGPAVQRNNGTDIWAVHGNPILVRHSDGAETWWLDDRLVGREESTREDVLNHARAMRDWDTVWAIEAYDVWYERTQGATS